MSWVVVLTEAAEQDINAAAGWYKREAAGLEKQFLDADTRFYLASTTGGSQFFFMPSCMSRAKRGLDCIARLISPVLASIA